MIALRLANIIARVFVIECSDIPDGYAENIRNENYWPLTYFYFCHFEIDG